MSHASLQGSCGLCFVKVDGEEVAACIAECPKRDATIEYKDASAAREYMRYYLPKFAFFRKPFCDAHRAAYHAVYRKWVRPRHPSVLRECAELGAALSAPVSCSIGIHKRVNTPGVAEFQALRE